MGKASSSKKVARAARTGGGRTRGRGRSSWGWPLAMGLIVVLGTAGVAFSRDQRQSQADTTPPRPSSQGAGDHWHSAIGFEICGTFAPNVQGDQDPLGIHSHADGVVHTHPFTERSSGKNARLKIFFDAMKIDIDENHIELPGQPQKKNGDKCEGRDAKVQAKVWDTRSPDDKGHIVEGDPGEILLKNNQLITIAFAPEDTEIHKPPSESQLDNLTDVEPAPTTTVPGAPEATTIPGTPEATTIPGTPTTAPSPTPTPAPTAPPTTAAL